MNKTTKWGVVLLVLVALLGLLPLGLGLLPGALVTRRPPVCNSGSGVERRQPGNQNCTAGRFSCRFTVQRSSEAARDCWGDESPAAGPGPAGRRLCDSRGTRGNSHRSWKNRLCSGGVAVPGRSLCCPGEPRLLVGRGGRQVESPGDRYSRARRRSAPCPASGL